MGAAVSGVAGPLVVAVAYFLAAPRLVGIRPEQLSAHLLAPYAVLAGLAGSVTVTALAQRAERPRPVLPVQREDEFDECAVRRRSPGRRPESEPEPHRLARAPPRPAADSTDDQPAPRGLVDVDAGRARRRPLTSTKRR